MKIKRILGITIASAMMLSLAACGGGEAETGASEGDVKVALLLNGTLGDKSFFDSGANGMKLIDEQLDGVSTKVIEMTYDQTKWEPALLDAIDEGNDIIVAGTWQMQEIITGVAGNYPDVKFIVYDTSMDYSNGGFENVYSIEYKQNDGSFLAGALAASISETNQVGFVGGMDSTVIYDFLVGYVEGAKYVNPDVKVTYSFVGSFSDTAKAKELANNQYNMGTDIIFSCASTAGDGVMQAAKEQGKYAIGVDSDQSGLYEANDPTLAGLIPTSVLKKIDVSLLQAIEAEMNGELEFGQRVTVGLAEESVGLIKNDVYEEATTEEIRELINELEIKIQEGEIVVSSAFGAEMSEILSIIDGK